MFYQTVLQKIGMGGAVDVEGRQLLFIGYMPVNVGDTVWTDGRVIFGNAPPKDSPLIPALPKGVPVLGDILRGYINRSGKYREKNIAVDEWIVNNKKIFEHGEEKNLLDVEVVKSEQNKFTTLYKAELTAENPKVKNSVVNFYKDKVLSERISLSDYNMGWKKADEFIDSVVTDLQRFKKIRFESPNYYRTFYAKYLPKEEINKAKILGVKIDSNGDCHAIVAGWRSFSYRLFEYNKTQIYRFDITSQHNNYKIGDVSAESYLIHLPHVLDLLDDLMYRLTDIDVYIYNYKYTSYGASIGYEIPNNPNSLRSVFTCFSYALAYFKNWQLEKIIDNNYLQTFFKVVDTTEEGITTTSTQSRIIGKTGYTKDVWASSATLHRIIHVDYTEEFQDWYMDAYTTDYANNGFAEENLFNVFKFPLQDGYTAEMNIWQIKAIYDETGKKICDELPIQKPSAFFEDYSSFINADGNIDVDWTKKRRIYVDGKIETFEVNTSDVEIQCGIFYYDDNGEKQDYFMPNVSVTKLTNEKYLIGFHKGNLYIVENGKVTKVTDAKNDNLKNFRLREMKNLNKAK